MLQLKWRILQIIQLFLLIIGLGLSHVISVAADEDLRLEGTSFIGSQRQAHVAWQGTRMTVKVGDAIGVWQVMKIAQHEIDLQNAEGETRHLALYAQPPLVRSSPPTDTTDSVTDAQAELPNDQPFAVKSGSEQPATVRTIIREYIPIAELEGQPIPAGYQAVKTPFGEFAVKQRRQSRAARLAEQANDTPQEDTTQPVEPTGYRLVKTPFGELAVPNRPAE